MITNLRGRAGGSVFAFASMTLIASLHFAGSPPIRARSSGADGARLSPASSNLAHYDNCHDFTSKLPYSPTDEEMTVVDETDQHGNVIRRKEQLWRSPSWNDPTDALEAKIYFGAIKYEYGPDASPNFPEIGNGWGCFYMSRPDPNSDMRTYLENEAGVPKERGKAIICYLKAHPPKPQWIDFANHCGQADSVRATVGVPATGQKGFIAYVTARLRGRPPRGWRVSDVVDSLQAAAKAKPRLIRQRVVPPAGPAIARFALVIDSPGAWYPCIVTGCCRGF